MTYGDDDQFKNLEKMRRGEVVERRQNQTLLCQHSMRKNESGKSAFAKPEK